MINYYKPNLIKGSNADNTGYLTDDTFVEDLLQSIRNSIDKDSCDIQLRSSLTINIIWTPVSILNNSDSIKGQGNRQDRQCQRRRS